MGDFIMEQRSFYQVRAFYSDNATGHFIDDKTLEPSEGSPIFLLRILPPDSERVTCTQGGAANEWDVAVRGG